MHEDVPTKAIAACFGLAGFVVAIICGMVVGNPIEETLSRAIPAMFVCVIVGYGIGTFTTRAISHNIQAAARAAAAAAAEAADTQRASLSRKPTPPPTPSRAGSPDRVPLTPQTPQSQHPLGRLHPRHERPRRDECVAVFTVLTV